MDVYSNKRIWSVIYQKNALSSWIGSTAQLWRFWDKRISKNKASYKHEVQLIFLKVQEDWTGRRSTTGQWHVHACTHSRAIHYSQSSSWHYLGRKLENLEETHTGMILSRHFFLSNDMKLKPKYSVFTDIFMRGTRCYKAYPKCLHLIFWWTLMSANLQISERAFRTMHKENTVLPIWRIFCVFPLLTHLIQVHGVDISNLIQLSYRCIG